MPDKKYAIDYQQKGQWLLNHIDEKHILLHLTRWTQCEEVDMGAFKQALAVLIAGHESLRTTFTVNNGVVMHKVHAFESLDPDDVLRVYRVADEDYAFCEELLLTAKTLPFALEEWPLFRVNLVHFQGMTYVMYSVHHIISDPPTMDVIDEAFTSIYASICAGKPVAKGNWGQFRTYFEWKKALLDGEQGAKARELWAGRVAEIKQSMLPEEEAGEPKTMAWLNEKINNRSAGAGKRGVTDKDIEVLLKVTPSGHREGGLYRFFIEQEEFTEFESFSFRNGYTPFMLLLTGFSITLNHVTERNCNLITFSASDREAFDSGNMIGWVVSSAYFYSTIKENQTFAELMEYVIAELANAIENKFYSIEDILKDGNLLVPFNKIVTLYLHYVKVDKEIALQPAAHVTGKEFNINYDLNFHFRQHNNGMEVLCYYNKALYRPAAIEAMSDEYMALLRWFTKNPGEKVQSYALKAPRQNQPVTIA